MIKLENVKVAQYHGDNFDEDHPNLPNNAYRTPQEEEPGFLIGKHPFALKVSSLKCILSNNKI